MDGEGFGEIADTDHLGTDINIQCWKNSIDLIGKIHHTWKSKETEYWHYCIDFYTMEMVLELLQISR